MALVPFREAVAHSRETEVHLACTAKHVCFVFDLGFFIAFLAVSSLLSGWVVDLFLIMTKELLISSSLKASWSNFSRQLQNVQVFLAMRLENNEAVHADRVNAVEKQGFPYLTDFIRTPNELVSLVHAQHPSIVVMNRQGLPNNSSSPQGRDVLVGCVDNVHHAHHMPVLPLEVEDVLVT